MSAERTERAARPTYARRSLTSAAYIGAAFLIYLTTTVITFALLGSALMASSAAAILLVPTYVLYRRFTRDLATQARRATPTQLATLLPGLLTIWLFSQAVALLLQGDAASAGTGSLATTSPSASIGVHLLLAVSIVVLAPIAEELLIRGVLYRELRRRLRLPVLPLALGTALVFAALHGNVVQFATTLVFGVYLALAYERTGTILVPVALHVGFNALVWFTPQEVVQPFTNIPSTIALGLAALLWLTGLYVQTRRGGSRTGTT